MKFFIRLCLAVLVLIGLSVLFQRGIQMWGGHRTATLSGDSVLHLDLQGIIINGKKFLKNLKDYREMGYVKAIVIDVNSPGGAVGPSQELFAELRRTREEFKKPIVCYSSGVMASGGYYAALGCDRIVAAPGALIGSIGVIMSFANLERLYDWAKVSRYSLTSGKFKDAGAEYRPMRDDEKLLFQEMIDEVYLQFKSAVKEARPDIKAEVLEQYTDGRVFTGAKAVELGFADLVGTYDQAVELAADLANLKKGHYNIFEVPKIKRSIFDFGDVDEDDTINTLLKNRVAKELKQALGFELLNQPVYLMPGLWTE